jgi:hypothetical protein
MRASRLDWAVTADGSRQGVVEGGIGQRIRNAVCLLHKHWAFDHFLSIDKSFHQPKKRTFSALWQHVVGCCISAV